MSTLIALLFASGQLAGCAGGGGHNIDLAIDPADPCGQARAEFSQSKTYFTDKIVSSAVAGGLMGALGGAVIGGAAGGGRGALIGAGVGLLAGALAGGTSAYYDNMREHAQDQATLARGINQDLQKENAELDHVNGTFARLRECRFAIAQQTKYQVRTGQMSRQQALTVLAYQHQLFDQEIDVARVYGTNMQKRQDQFAVAADQLRKNDASYVPPPPPNSVVPTSRRRAPPPPQLTPTQQVVTAATETIPEKRSSFVASVDDASKKGQVAFNLDAAGGAS